MTIMSAHPAMAQRLKMVMRRSCRCFLRLVRLDNPEQMLADCAEKLASNDLDQLEKDSSKDSCWESISSKKDVVVDDPPLVDTESRLMIECAAKLSRAARLVLRLVVAPQLLVVVAIVVVKPAPPHAALAAAASVAACSMACCIRRSDSSLSSMDSSTSSCFSNTL